MRPGDNLVYAILGAISIHAPTWGATGGGEKESSKLEFQSTHPRGVRRDELLKLHPAEEISIHAPTWGATAYGDGQPHRAEISIHAPTWGATLVACVVGGVSFHFNPRTHVGCDERPLPRLLLFYFISIHAPTWGAT